MNFYDQYKTQLVLPEAILTHLLAIFPSSETFTIWLYFYQNESLAPSQIAAFLKSTTSEVNQAIALLTNSDTLSAEFDEVTGEMRFDTRPAFAKLDRILAEDKAETTNVDQDETSESDITRLIAAFEPEMPGGLTPMTIEELQKWLSDDKFEADLILLALHEAALNRKVSLPYIRAILRNWRNDGVITARDIERNKEERELRKETPDNQAPLSEEFFSSADALGKLWGFSQD
ncbi:DnaD domain-containing protein [Pseudolactococcus insecticola]|uniref:DNA replication protein DnaD n=1 Tax=Pseudolactococcus insecticola TaxID=2709158 RepID=A0A6A0B828_9LACT|nr:DnaD domain-containing protein [Lactococcus insecticola]GFH39947.1 DNA replication protein DnaD [Lactococcus insecticola]